MQLHILNFLCISNPAVNYGFYQSQKMIECDLQRCATPGACRWIQAQTNMQNGAADNKDPQGAGRA